MASDLMDSYIQQFSHNTAEIVSTTTKIPTLNGGIIIALLVRFVLLLSEVRKCVMGVSDGGLAP